METRRLLRQELLATIGQSVDYQPGHELVRAGDDVRDVWILRAGVLKLCATSMADQRWIAIATPTTFIGASAAIAGLCHPATVSALTKCTAHRVSIGQFSRLLETHSDFAASVTIALAHELCASYRRRAADSRRGRRALWTLMHELFAVASTDDGNSRRLLFPLSVTDAAQLLGITRQWASVLFAEMERKRLMAREKGWLVAPISSPLYGPRHNNRRASPR